jgi:amidase
MQSGRKSRSRGGAGTGGASQLVALAAIAGLTAACAQVSTQDETKVERQSLRELRRALDAGTISSEALVRVYFKRIEAIDKAGPRLNSILWINPDAISQARELDRELRAKGARGPLHGIPILLKDNIESADRMPTTAGSMALANNFTARDAPIAANLRAAGAVILGKTNLSEWANFRSEQSISGWSGLGGLTRNPHVLDRSACGSSSGSGSAVAASLAAAAVGTETDGSITCPASMNGVVGLKPTLGLLAGARIVPIAHSQDTAGPMTGSVEDAAIMLNAMVGAQAACSSHLPDCRRDDYVGALSANALAGKRVGVLRFRAGRNPHITPLYERSLTHLRDAGATLIEVTLPETNKVSAAEEIVLNTEFRADLNAYLATLPAAVTARDLSQLIEFNRKTPRELSLFGQEIFEQAQVTAGLDDPAYRNALAESKRLAGPEGLTRLLTENRLDLLVAPTNGTSWRIDVVNGDHFSGSFSSLPAVSGYPHLTVPMGTVNDLPVGISFIGPPWSDALLLGAGFAFESRAGGRPLPAFKPSAESTPAFDPQK